MQEVQQLRDAVRELKDAKAKLESYEMHQLEPGKFVYKSKQSHHPQHFACPRCFAGCVIGILQASDSATTGRTRWNCSVCTFEGYTGTATTYAVRDTVGGGWLAE